MLLKRLSDSILHFPSISEVSDNSNRLYNLDGVLYFNGIELGSGDVENVWVNSNDFSTYTTVTANLYDTWVSLNTSIDLLNGNSNVSVEDLVVGLEGANTNIDTVQANLSAQFNETSPGQIPALNSSNTGFINSGMIYNANTSSLGVGVSSAEDIEARLHIVGTGTANTREVLFKVNNSDDHDRIEFIDESSNDSLPSALRNRGASYGLGLIAESGPVRLYSGGSAANNEILAATATGVRFHDEYTFPTTDGSANQFLQTDGSGAVSFASVTVSDISDLTATATELNLLDGVTGLTLGDANEILIVGANGDSITSTDVFSIDDTNNYIGINQTSPEVALHMTGEASQSAQIRMEQHHDGADAPDIRTRKSRGTAAAPAKNAAGDFIYRQNHERYNGTGWVTVGQLAVDTDDTNADRFVMTFTVSEDGTSVDAADNQLMIDGNDSGAITFNQAYKFPTSDGTINQVLQTDGSGNISFATLFDSSANDYNTWKTVNTAIDTVQANLTLDNASLTANTYNTYDVLTANVYNTYIAIVGSDGITTSQVVANLYNTWVSVNTEIDTVQANVDTGVANLYNTWKTVNTAIDTVQANVDTGAANLYNTWETVNTAIDTVQANVDTGVANLYNTWKTVNTAIDTVQANLTSIDSTITANLYNTWETVNTEIDTVQANLTSIDSTITANLYNTWETVNTAIDTVQANLTSIDTTITANLYNTWETVNTEIDTVQANLTSIDSTITANLYNTWETVNTAIDTVNANVAFDNPDLLLPSANLTGVVGNVSKTYSSGHFNSLNVLTTIYSDKILYSNMYANEVDLPSATDYHGMFAHVHATGAGYFSHAGNWNKLVDNTTPTIAASTALVAGATTNPSTSTLHVTGNAYITSDILIGGTLTETSTIKIKENIVPLNNQLDKLMLLRPVEYDKINSRNHEYGLIAEEVANVLPEAVSSGNSAIQYTRLIPTLIKAVQELKQEVQELRNGST